MQERIDTLIRMLKINEKTLNLLKQFPEEKQLELLESFYDFVLKNEMAKRLLDLL